MELIESEDKEQGALPEPEPRHKSEPPAKDSGSGQAVVRIVALVLAAIIIVILLIILARWIYHVAHHNSAPAASNSSSANKQPALPGAQSGARGTPAGGNKPSANSKTAPAGGGKIADTGPGDVAGLFIGATLAAAALHFIISVRRKQI